jgi:predicted membrane chloride channel (bestrophin family)
VLNKCAQSHNRPLWIADRLALEFTEIKYDENFSSRERLELLKHASKLGECIGHCERIHQTAVPLNYARHALRSLTLWSFTLPFGLVDKLGLMTGPVVGIVAWLMYGVYEIGHRIEDPFQGSLRLSDLCNAIYRDVMFGDRNQAGMRRQSAFRKDNEKESDWDRVGDAFGLKRTREDIPIMLPQPVAAS